MSLKKVIIVPDVYNKSTWAEADVEDVLQYLHEQFAPSFPKNARIYHNDIAQSKDVTPKNSDDIEYIKTLSGQFYVVVYPAIELFTIFAIITGVMAAFSLYSVLTMPKPPTAAVGSSNNELANRTNQARLNGRIPDIFGRVRAYPDLIAQAYSIYVDGIEIEECLMCIGRGYYQILDMRDGETDVANIPGTSVSVYNPNVQIVGANQAFYQVGETFTELPIEVKKSVAINGQTLKRPNDTQIESNQIWFESPNYIKSNSIDFSQYFSSGENVAVYNAEYGVLNVAFSGSILVTEDFHVIIESTINVDNPNAFKALQLTGAQVDIVTNTGTPPVLETTSRDLSGQYIVSGITKTTISTGFHYDIVLSNPSSINPNWSLLNDDYTISAGAVLNQNENGINLGGTYTISSMTANSIALINPSAINPEWDKLATLPNQSTQGQNIIPRLDSVNNKWVGWFNLDMQNAEGMYVNLVWPQGLFWQSRSGRQDPTETRVRIQYQMLDEDGDQFGDILESVLFFREYHTSQFGRTMTINFGQSGSFRFRACMDWPTDSNYRGEVKIKDVYAFAQSDKDSYGNVTVVRSRTIATDGALSLKERKLNCLVNRKLPLDGTGALQVTRSAAQALIYNALDQHVGRRSFNEIDIAQINAEIEKVNTYFGSSIMSEFNYTIDDDNLSFEETAGMIASSAFCEPNRFGSLLRLKFEQPQDNSVLLFNHRNKAPNTEKRTYTFGVQKDYDGVELEYTSDEDDARIKYTVPEGITLKNPLKITTSGIRNEAQAKVRAWREWNKLKYKYVSCEFEALDESELLIRNDRILVADNTRTKTQDGQVIAVDGLTVHTSQPCFFESGFVYYAYFQLPDASVDMIKCSTGPDDYSMTLARAPLLPLVVDPDRYVKTLYSLVKADEREKQAFMLEELTPQTQMTNTLKASNYDARFYERDHDFI